MESIPVDLLSGLAAGAGGDAGRLAWTRLVELVRKPLPDTGRPGTEGSPAAGSGGIPQSRASGAAASQSGGSGGPSAVGESAASGARCDGDVPHRSAPVPTGELELTLLGHEAPGGLRAYTRAYALAGALALRAERDPDFARSLGHWYAEARRIGPDGPAASGEGGGSGSGARGGCCGRGGHGVIVLGEGVDGLDGPFRLGPAEHSGGWAIGGDPEGAEGSVWPADGASEDGEAGTPPG
ncbi:hypothetical protein B4N89_05540 [Embleya scabrispora]|uniref:Uncharacterized protein n=1 Tax=Embleya scabrispora TaxID=159449 RepID=A0A1T3NUS0_9ACTN|nr:hypothetical protein [Embleya scabrispora]OPC80485.1 hypothetical protein B4N89_05540 [Embleya scabrispora]